MLKVIGALYTDREVLEMCDKFSFYGASKIIYRVLQDYWPKDLLELDDVEIVLNYYYLGGESKS